MKRRLAFAPALARARGVAVASALARARGVPVAVASALAPALALALAPALAACNGAAQPVDTTDAAIEVVDLSGMYRVDSAVGSDTACDADAPIEAPAYLQLVRVDFTQNPEPLIFTSDHFFSTRACDDAAGTTCRASSYLELGQPIDGGWRTPIPGYSTVGDVCTLRFYVFTALLDGSALGLELFAYSEQVANEQCNVDEARTRGATMPCTGHKLITATRL